MDIHFFITCVAAVPPINLWQLDQRLDTIELRAVQEFVSKDDFNSALNRMEAHLIRMENKIDILANKKCEP